MIDEIRHILLELGEDVILVPTYTPLRTDETDVSINRVFFGGINVYLDQSSDAYGRVPRFVRMNENVLTPIETCLSECSLKE